MAFYYTIVVFISTMEFVCTLPVHLRVFPKIEPENMGDQQSLRLLAGIDNQNENMHSQIKEIPFANTINRKFQVTKPFSTQVNFPVYFDISELGVHNAQSELIADPDHIVNDYPRIALGLYGQSRPQFDYSENGNYVFQPSHDITLNKRNVKDVKEPYKRSFSLRKRIHTCAFMRRFGLPIGMCFRNMWLNFGARTSTPAPEKPAAKQKDDYAHLQWPIHSLLG